MENLNPGNPAAPVVEQTPALVVSMTRCTTSGCAWSFEQGKGFVPALPLLYQQVRGGAVDRRYPLTRSEVLGKEICPMHCAPRLRHNGVQAHPTGATLHLMERWAGENVAYLERQHQRREVEEQQGRQSAAGPGMRSPIVREIARGGHPYHGKKKARPRKGYDPKPPRDPSAPKRFGDEGRRLVVSSETASNNKKKKKKGKGDDAQAGKGKNKKK